ncbi:MAG: protein O-mannosyl-transferase family [Candidatus Rifleibacteriota bacterium]
MKLNKEDKSFFIKNKWVWIFTLLATSVLYLPDITNNIGWYNSGEFVVAALTLDVPHAPGYPLLTRLGNWFVNLPIDQGPAWKMNLLSAFTAITALLAFAFLTARVKIRSLAAIAALSTLMASRTFYDQAVSIEVYCLEVFFIILGLLAGILLAENSNSNKTAFFAGLAGAIGVGHRPTFALYIPALLFFISVRTQPLKKLSIKWFSFGLFAGLIPSLDLFFRLQSNSRVLLDPMIGKGLFGFLRVFTGTVYQGGLFTFSFAEVLNRFLYFFRFIVFDSGPFILPLAMIALFIKSGYEPLKKAFVFIGMLNLIFVLNYNAFEAHSMLLPSIMALCGLAAFTLNSIKNSKLYIFSCLLVILLAFVNNLHERKPPDSEPVEYCKRMFSSIPSKAVVLMSNDVEFRPYYYLRLTQNFRPDVGVQLVDAIENKELRQIDSLLQRKAVSGVFSTLIYPEEAAAKLVASFSLPADGYSYRIARATFPQKLLKESKVHKKIEIKNSRLLLPKLSLIDSEVNPGEPLAYSYAFSGKVQDFKNLTIWAFLSDRDGNKIYRHNLLVGQDCHSPADFTAQPLLKAKNKIELMIKRSLIIPYDLEPGSYTLNIGFQLVESDSSQPNNTQPEGVNLFNLNGFIEVFKLKYGLSQRNQVDKSFAENIQVKPGQIIPLQVRTLVK